MVTHPVFMPGESHSSIHAWKNPMDQGGYSPWGRKELDMTERLHFTSGSGFPRQEYWAELPFPSPGDLSKPGI